MGIPVVSRSLRNDYFGGPKAFEGFYRPPDYERVCIDMSCAPMRLDEIRLEKYPFSLYFLFRNAKFPECLP